jgi:signal transduction histidine kinase
VRWRGQAQPDERLTISQTIIDHVRETGRAVVTTNAPADARFSPSQSIAEYAIREAICVPIQGRHSTLGVLYADAVGDVAALAPDGKPQPSRFGQEHLMLMGALGYQAGLAIENTQFYQAKLQAERLAAIGQTIATLSHDIKNILQGLRGGSSLIELGLEQKDEAVVRRGWSMVEKNQGKIYNLVLDMLSFCKDREPDLIPSDLNRTVDEVVELVQARAGELSVRLFWVPDRALPEVRIDPEAIHRALLNIVANALDACGHATDAYVRVGTSWDPERGLARVTVEDNGTGIADEDLPTLFQPFSSTKGTRGTGLGLPVSQKIVREHGGQITVSSRAGGGTVFVVELPQRSGEPGGAEVLATLS